MQGLVSFFGELCAEHGIGWVIGQGFGILAMILGFFSFQMKTPRKILFVHGAVSLTFCIHYFLIGAYSGMAMNFVNIARNFFYDRRTQKGSKSQTLPIIFVAIQAAMCALTWEAWYSVFVLLGIGVNTYCMSFSNAQRIRVSVLISSPLVLIYDVFAGSVGGIICETLAVSSALIGICKSRKHK